MNKIFNVCIGISASCLISLSAQASPPTQPGVWNGDYNIKADSICNLKPTDTVAVLTQKSYNNGVYSGTLVLKGFPQSTEYPEFSGGKTADVTYTIMYDSIVTISFSPADAFTGYNAYYDGPPPLISAV